MIPQSTPEQDDALPIAAYSIWPSARGSGPLIHLEQVWAENRLTAEGRLLHERVDLPGQSRRRNIRTVRGMALESSRLRLTGRADVVEFPPKPFPLEYKRGKRKPTDCDIVQLCAQAMCIEEMLSRVVPRGAIFYGEPRRRLEVEFTAELRGRTEALAASMHRLYAARETPAAQTGPHCRRCSLIHICLPEGIAQSCIASRWQAAQLRPLRSES